MSENANLVIEILKTPQNIRKLNREFTGNIFENKYFINLEYLLSDSIPVNFSHSWICNPQNFCLDQYSVYEVYPVILLVNKVNSMFEFRPENLKNIVISPSIDSIYKVLSLIS